MIARCFLSVEDYCFPVSYYSARPWTDVRLRLPERRSLVSSDTSFYLTCVFLAHHGKSTASQVDSTSPAAALSLRKEQHAGSTNNQRILNNQPHTRQKATSEAEERIANHVS